MEQDSETRTMGAWSYTGKASITINRKGFYKIYETHQEYLQAMAAILRVKLGYAYLIDMLDVGDEGE